jgi:hypothetical protein
MFAWLGISFWAVACHAFQIAPLGHQSEKRLTNEFPSRVVEIGGRVGVLLKAPVHEEITQLGFGCPVELDALENDRYCATSNEGSAPPYVIYGVRWNDLPPFRLTQGQGAGCKKLGLLNQPACNIDQTVRLSTQPDCWYCIFKNAAQRATKKKITGCQRGPEYEAGNLMTRSHFGDLQFLHAMASDENVRPEETRQKILEWAEFAWRVFAKDIKPSTLLKEIQIPTIREHFGCTDWTVADIYILGRTDFLLPKIDLLAFGSVLHTVQDSFAAGHTEREPPVMNEMCQLAPTMPHPGRIVEFHSYGAQDSNKHDVEDSREALVRSGTTTAWPVVIEVSRRLAEFYNDNVRWEQARGYFECLFELSANARRSSPGNAFRPD